jgi:hypothetical protein
VGPPERVATYNRRREEVVPGTYEPGAAEEDSDRQFGDLGTAAVGNSLAVEVDVAVRTASAELLSE